MQLVDGRGRSGGGEVTVEEEEAGGGGEAEKPKKKKKNVLKKVFTQCPPREKGRPSRRTALRPPLKSGRVTGPPTLPTWQGTGGRAGPPCDHVATCRTGPNRAIGRSP